MSGRIKINGGKFIKRNTVALMLHIAPSLEKNMVYRDFKKFPENIDSDLLFISIIKFLKEFEDEVQ